MIIEGQTAGSKLTMVGHALNHLILMRVRDQGNIPRDFSYNFVSRCYAPHCTPQSDPHT